MCVYAYIIFTHNESIYNPNKCWVGNYWHGSLAVWESCVWIGSWLHARQGRGALWQLMKKRYWYIYTIRIRTVNGESGKKNWTSSNKFIVFSLQPKLIIPISLFLLITWYSFTVCIINFLAQHLKALHEGWQRQQFCITNQQPTLKKYKILSKRKCQKAFHCNHQVVSSYSTSPH